MNERDEVSEPILPPEEFRRKPRVVKPRVTDKLADYRDQRMNDTDGIRSYEPEIV